MIILYAGLTIFFATHLYSTFRPRAPERNIKERMGERQFMALFSALSLLGLVLIVWGYGTAGPMPFLYVAGGRGLTLMAMLPALILLAAAQLPRGYIKHTIRHPMLVAVIIWSAVHLIDGASMRQLALFGSFLAYAVIDLVAVSVRRRYTDTTPPTPRWRYDLVAVVVGGVLYGVLMAGLHRWLFGIQPAV